MRPLHPRRLAISEGLIRLDHLQPQPYQPSIHTFARHALTSFSYHNPHSYLHSNIHKMIIHILTKNAPHTLIKYHAHLLPMLCYLFSIIPKVPRHAQYSYPRHRSSMIPSLLTLIHHVRDILITPQCFHQSLHQSYHATPPSSLSCPPFAALPRPSIEILSTAQSYCANLNFVASNLPNPSLGATFLLL